MLSMIHWKIASCPSIQTQAFIAPVFMYLSMKIAALDLAQHESVEKNPQNIHNKRAIAIGDIYARLLAVNFITNAPSGRTSSPEACSRMTPVAANSSNTIFTLEFRCAG